MSEPRTEADLVATDLLPGQGVGTHYMVVVLRDDQLERIADAVAERLFPGRAKPAPRFSSQALPHLAAQLRGEQ